VMIIQLVCDNSMHTKVKNPVLGPELLFFWLLHPYTFLTPKIA
jgi:hypothetical protein